MKFQVLRQVLFASCFLSWLMYSFVLGVLLVGVGDCDWYEGDLFSLLCVRCLKKKGRRRMFRKSGVSGCVKLAVGFDP